MPVSGPWPWASICSGQVGRHARHRCCWWTSTTSPGSRDHGHAAGDALLRAVGACLARRLRISDVAARLGRDQFAVLLWATEEDGAITVGWDLVAVIDRIRLNSPEPEVAATASVGLVVLDARARDAPAIMDSATAALAQAKAAGGHRVAIAHPQANDLQEVGRPGS